MKLGILNGASLAAALVIGSFATTSTPAQARDHYLGEVMTFGGNFCPRGWAKMEGQLLAISQNQALFSILGTTYGGDGRTTFGLPDMRGRVLVGPGQAPGLSSRRLGEKSGIERNRQSFRDVPVPSSDEETMSIATPVNDQSEENLQPYLVMTYCIAIEGIYPTRR